MKQVNGEADNLGRVVLFQVGSEFPVEVIALELVGEISSKEDTGTS